MQMTGYTKLFGSIITSTIWREKNETRILWITMLALKNKAGVVEGSIPGLADMARLSVDDTVAALEILRSPDPYSRTKENEGRRIQDIEGGWLVINHKKWREKMNLDERRDYLRVKQQESRARKSTTVNKRKQTSTPSTHTDTDTDTIVEGTSASSPTGKTELEWRGSVAADPAYQHIRVSDEFSKMMRWCEVNKKQPTRRRFINWLNRIEKPMTARSGSSKTTSKPKYVEFAPLPSEETLAANREAWAKEKAKLNEKFGAI